MFSRANADLPDAGVTASGSAAPTTFGCCLVVPLWLWRQGAVNKVWPLNVSQSVVRCINHVGRFVAMELVRVKGQKRGKKKAKKKQGGTDCKPTYPSPLCSFFASDSQGLVMENDRCGSNRLWETAGSSERLAGRQRVERIR